MAMLTLAPAIRVQFTFDEKFERLVAIRLPALEGDTVIESNRRLFGWAKEAKFEHACRFVHHGKRGIIIPTKHTNLVWLEQECGIAYVIGNLPPILRAIFWMTEYFSWTRDR